MHTQGQGNQEIHHPQHGRVCRYPYVNPLEELNRMEEKNYLWRDWRRRWIVWSVTDGRTTQVISRTPPSSPNTPSQRCTSSSSTAYPALSTERSFGTFSIPSAAHRSTAQRGRNTYVLTSLSVRSREGRRNRAPPPRVRYNKDGKKVNPLNAAKGVGGAAA